MSRSQPLLGQPMWLADMHAILSLARARQGRICPDGYAQPRSHDCRWLDESRASTVLPLLDKSIGDVVKKGKGMEAVLILEKLVDVLISDLELGGALYTTTYMREAQ